MTFGVARFLVYTVLKSALVFSGMKTPPKRARSRWN